MIILQQNVNNILIIFIRGHFANSLKVGKGSLNLQVLRVKVCKRICLRKIKIKFKKRLDYLLAVPEVTYYHVKINIIFFFDDCLAYSNENWLEGFLSKIFFMKIV